MLALKMGPCSQECWRQVGFGDRAKFWLACHEFIRKFLKSISLLHCIIPPISHSLEVSATS